MSDIFLSYASADREQAKQCVCLLEQHGWSVWWDRSIPAGRTFDRVIEEELAQARCVIVLWSHASAGSDWVRTEAADGLLRKILVPAMIVKVEIPLEFRRVQAADLSDWKGDPNRPGNVGGAQQGGSGRGFHWVGLQPTSTNPRRRRSRVRGAPDDRRCPDPRSRPSSVGRGRRFEMLAES